MLGIASNELALAFVLCIAASVLCIIYGIVNWNRSGPSSEELREFDTLTSEPDRPG